MSIADRMRALGLSDERIKSLGLKPPANETQVRTDGLNPEGITHAANRERARELAEQAVLDILRWRAYRDSKDPFERARMSRGMSASIERGRELDTTGNDNGDPSAA
jgi:hypothetical protein